MTAYHEQIRRYIELEKAVLDSLSVEDINTVINVLEAARESGHRIYVCGNGGSASTAAHFECDFSYGPGANMPKGFRMECLCNNMATVMAVSNDIGYEDVFFVQLQNRLQEGDVVIAISGSGKSENVIRALRYGNSVGAETVAFTGYDGGTLKSIAKYSIHVPLDFMQMVEDVHLMLNHMLISVLARII